MQPNTNPSRQATQQTSWHECLGKLIFRRPSVHMPKKESKSKGTLTNYKTLVLSNTFKASTHLSSYFQEALAPFPKPNYKGKLAWLKTNTQEK